MWLYCTGSSAAIAQSKKKCANHATTGKYALSVYVYTSINITLLYRDKDYKEVWNFKKKVEGEGMKSVLCYHS